MHGVAERVGDDVILRLGAHERAGGEVPHRQLHEIDVAAHLGIGGEQNLETAVETKTIDDVGAHATTNAVACLEKRDTTASALQVAGARETRKTSTYDDDVVGLARVLRCGHLLAEKVAQCRFERGVREHVTIGEQSFGHHALAGEQQGIGKL